jgi:predicted flap endonuclease-1-like 5' DNA nuclease
MGLLDKIKSFLGQDDAGQPAPAPETARAEGGTNVTVEREPTGSEAEAGLQTETEATVKGVDTAAESVSATDEPGDGGSEGDSDAEAETTGESDPVDSIKGIGSAYADRLADAGIETVTDLLAADLERVAEEADISQSRLETWRERARE